MLPLVAPTLTLTPPDPLLRNTTYYLLLQYIVHAAEQRWDNWSSFSDRLFTAAWMGSGLLRLHRQSACCLPRSRIALALALGAWLLA